MTKTKTILAVAASAFGIAIASAPASAQGIPVVDPSNIAQTVKVVQNGIQQVQQMKQQVEQMTTMAKTIGQNGPLAIATDVLKKSGLDFADAAASPLAPYRAAMPGILDALPNTEVGKAIGIGSSLAQKAKTNITSGREFALQAFFKPGQATQAEVEQRRGVREAAMRDSVTAGYAMAIYAKNQMGDETNGVPKMMKNLSEGVSKAADLRGDVQSNSAIALAQLSQTAMTNQLIAQLLEVQATGNMATQQAGLQ